MYQVSILEDGTRYQVSRTNISQHMHTHVRIYHYRHGHDQLANLAQKHTQKHTEQTHTQKIKTQHETQLTNKLISPYMYPKIILSVSARAQKAKRKTQNAKRKTQNAKEKRKKKKEKRKKKRENYILKEFEAPPNHSNSKL